MKRFGTIFFKKSPTASVRSRTVRRALAAFVIISLVAIWSMFVGIVVQSHGAEEAIATTFAGDVAALLDRDIARDLDVYDAMIKALAKKLADGRVLNQSVDRVRTEVESTPDILRGGTLFVVDKSGVVVAASKPMDSSNLSDRDYFTIHRDGPDTERFSISHPFRDASGRWFVVSSRRLANMDGSFYGIVACSIALETFVNSFKSVRLPPRSSIALFNETGMILTRVANANAQFVITAPKPDLYERFKTVSEGAFVSKSLVDEFVRVYAFRKVGNSTLGLIVGLAVDDVFQSWHLRTLIIGSGFFILSGLVIGLAIFLSRELSRRTLAETALAHLASTDSLTALSNRRRFDEILAQEWKRTARMERPIALMMIDVDFFKNFNDTYGHLAGDEVLAKIAATLQAEIRRPADLVARYGGEEFVVILPETTRDGALHVAEAMREAVLALGLAH